MKMLDGSDTLHGASFSRRNRASLAAVAALFAAALALAATPAGAQEPAAAPDDGPVKLFPIVKDGKWGFMDEAGNVAIEPQYEAAYDFSEGLACVIVNGWRGFIDRTGTMVIKPDLAWAGRFTEGLAPVYNEKSDFGGRPQFYRPSSGRFCCIDKKGKVVTDCSTAGFREGKTVVNRNRCLGKDGKEIKHDAEELHLFSGGLAGARKGSVWGYLDHSMKWAIPPQFHKVDSFSGGLAAVAKADPPLPETGRPWDWEKKAKFTWGFCDKEGKMVVDFKFEDAWPFSEGLAAVRLGGKWGYIDTTGKVVVEPAYDHAWPFSEGLGRVLVGEKQGYIDREGKMVIQPQFQPAWEFSMGLARVAIGGKEGYINHKGEYVWTPTK